MDTNSFLNISQLSFELDSGEAIIKFLIKRFKKWIPGINQSGQILYNHKDLMFLIFLLDKINKGILPSAIEEELNNGKMEKIFPGENLLTQQHSIDLQERRTKALEQRAKAEEKKASAMEKNVEIEALKIEAMNNIATAISNFNFTIKPSSGNEQIIKSPKTDDLSQLLDTDETDTDNKTIVQIDDLSKLIDKKLDVKTEVVIDDLALLIDNNNSNENKLDDLSILIQDENFMNLNTTDIDDLSSLLDVRSSDNYELDDLSLLIQDKEQDKETIDDLSLLIQDKEQDKGTIDDLSILIEKEKPHDDEIDDLSSLISLSSDEKAKIQKPECSPKDDFETYKSEIINIIIDLKSQGFTEDETLEQFNQQGILTLSGKQKWSIKTISQIYQLINNAA